MVTARSATSQSNKKKKKPTLTRSAFGRAGIAPPRQGSSVSTARPKQLPRKSMPGKGSSSFDPSNATVPPALLPFGRYFPLMGLSRVDLTPTGITTHMLFVSCVPGTGTIGAQISFQGTTVPAVVPVINMVNMPLLALSADAGGPSSVKASKAGVIIENTTALLSVAGRVYVTNLHQRINLGALPPSAITAVGWLGIADIIKSFPETEVYTGSHFLEGKKHECRVVDDPDYANFDAHRGNLDANTFFNHIGLSTGSTERSRPMSTICIVFDTVGASTTAGNDYTITCRAQHLTRWPLNTVPGQNMRESQAATAAAVNASRMARLQAGTR